MRLRAFSAAALSTEKILIVPSSSISIVAPVSSVIARMVVPPLPMTSRILSGWILMVVIRGAYSDISGLDDMITSFILPRMCMRPVRACARATSMISLVIPLILISICSAVTPLAVPATLKSMSPRWSSSPMISERTTNFSLPLINPIAIPATGASIATPASISDRLVPQTDAMELEPLDSVISDTTRIA